MRSILPSFTSIAGVRETFSPGTTCPPPMRARISRRRNGGSSCAARPWAITGRQPEPPNFRQSKSREKMRAATKPCFAFLAGLACAVLAINAKADAVADFYAGNQINLFVSSATGGGYDNYARLLA